MSSRLRELPCPTAVQMSVSLSGGHPLPRPELFMFQGLTSLRPASSALIVAGAGMTQTPSRCSGSILKPVPCPRSRELSTHECLGAKMEEENLGGRTGERRSKQWQHLPQRREACFKKVRQAACGMDQRKGSSSQWLPDIVAQQSYFVTYCVLKNAHPRPHRL